MRKNILKPDHSVKRVLILSPAKCIDDILITQARTILSRLGFNVSSSRHVTERYNYFSGTDEQRLHDMQNAIDDTDIDFILCARGGYGTIRLIENLDFTHYMNTPKPIIGFSDITVIHSKMRNIGIPSIHATMPFSFSSTTRAALDSLVRAMQGKQNTYHIRPHPLNREGSVTAPVVGGNLAVLSSLMGTPLEPDFSGCTLFIEDVDEAVYAVERMLWQMKMARKLDSLQGLVIGGFTKIRDTEIPYGFCVEEVIADMVKEYDFPVCFNFPAGHIEDNRAIILGKEATLNVERQESTFIQ